MSLQDQLELQDRCERYEEEIESLKALLRTAQDDIELLRKKGACLEEALKDALENYEEEAKDNARYVKALQFYATPPTDFTWEQTEPFEAWCPMQSDKGQKAREALKTEEE